MQVNKHLHVMKYLGFKNYKVLGCKEFCSFENYGAFEILLLKL
jgi:hypothetical protein